jgi:hypothetical protein
MVTLVGAVVGLLLLYFWLSGRWLGWLAALVCCGYLVLRSVQPATDDLIQMILIAFVVLFGTGLPFIIRSRSDRRAANQNRSSG